MSQYKGGVIHWTAGSYVANNIDKKAIIIYTIITQKIKLQMLLKGFINLQII
ncbi:MAG: hypothetical protein L6V95_01790 [Candidatus Melainabacteria bacterium]|nr:MAG: hypothetical protein L6V95_01790 [Candidatus Melainabacteria bacterium]